MRSLKASPLGLKKIKEARETEGSAIDNPKWLEEASNLIPPVKNGKNVLPATVSIGTWKRFLQGTPVKPLYFKAFCQVLELDWEEVVDIKDEVKGGKDEDKSSPTKYDWDSAPDVSIFYDRSIERNQLKQWLINDKCRLVTILAMGGVGKTALAVKLAQEVSEEFDYIIWRSLREAPTVEKIIADVVKFLSLQQEIELPQSLGEKITRLIHYFNTSRCLLILDNGESILQGGSSTGCYREGYEGYGELFRRVGECQHQSCLLLTSREQFQEMRPLAGESLPVRVWELEGLQSATEILTTRGISGLASDIEELIELYHGNPLALQIVPATIKKLFNGNIRAFLDSGTIIFDDIDDLLTQQFQRLSKPEQSLMYWLAINRQPVLQSDLFEDVLGLSQRQILSSLNSLLGRCLIQSTHDSFTLQNVVMEYVSEVFIDKVINELECCELDLLRTHAIIKASAPDYIRENQTQVLLKPVVGYLCKNHTKRVIEHKFRIIVEKLREKELQVPVGYAGGNLINLLIQLQVNLNGYDFSRLPISQAYLQGVELSQVNFNDCSFNKTVFSQSLGSIFSVTFSPDQKLLATGGMDGQIRLWNVADSTQILAWQAHDDWIRCVAFSSDGKLIASCGNDRAVRIWDSESAKCLKIFRGHTDWVWSVYFVLGKRLVVSASSDRTAKVWSLDLEVCIYTFHEPDREVWSFAFSNNGKTLATGGASSIRLWNVWTNKCLKTFDENSTRVRTLAFSPDGKTLVGSSDNQSIKAWDVKSGKCLLRVKTAPTGAIWAVKFSQSGKTVISCGTDKIQLWNLENGEPLRTFHEPHHRIRSLAYSPDQKMIAVGSDDQLVRLWDTQTGEAIKTFQGYSNRIWSVAVNPVPQQDIICLASGSDDGNIRLWNAATGECYQTLSGHQGRIRHVSFSPDGALLASASHDRTIKLWDVSTGTCLKTWRGHTDWVWSVIFQNNHTLISASDDHTIRLWDTHTNQSQILENLETEWMWAIALSPHTETLATAGTGETINFWDIHTRKCLTSLKGHTHRLRAITFNEDGKLIASSSDDFSIRLWNVETQQCLQLFWGHTGEIRALTFIPASDNTPSILISASDDATIRLWDTKTGCFKVLTGHQNRIWSLCYSEQLDILFSCGEDETIKLWDIRALNCIKTLRIPKPYEGMNINGVSGLTDATLLSLRVLGAVSGTA